MLELGLILTWSNFPGFRQAFDPAEINWAVDPAPFTTIDIAAGMRIPKSIFFQALEAFVPGTFKQIFSPIFNGVARGVVSRLYPRRQG